MSTQRQISPELQELLEEVARDPRSHVLRIPKLHVPVKAEAPVRDREALLTQAERQLVKVHRFEVADLLLQEVRRAVIAGEEAAGRLLKYESNAVISKAPDPVEWESRARYRLGAVPDDFEDRDALSLLGACVGTTPGERPSPVQLAFASLRLLPQPKTRICLGLALHQQGQTFSGLETLWDVLAGDPSDLMRSYAWQNVAELEQSLGHQPKNLEALRLAALTSCHRGDPAMGWFAGALRYEGRSEILRSARNLEESILPGHPSINAFIDTRAKYNDVSGCCLASRQASEFRALEAQLPEQARRIGNALSGKK